MFYSDITYYPNVFAPTYFLHTLPFCAHAGIFDLQAGSTKTRTEKESLAT